MIKKYDKLVRDKIPAIIEADGKKCCVEILSQEEYIAALDRKLNEELNEYYNDSCIEELADILEVLRAVAVARGYSIKDLEQMREAKFAARGGFDKRIFLKKVEDCDNE